MVWHAPDWNWIVAATLLLGINQGLTWSMTQTAALDITRPDQRGLTIGLNEFAGYLGVALPDIGWIIGIYGIVWGASQLVTGQLSDHVGRQRPNVWGMWICGAGVAMMVSGQGLLWWSAAAALSGFGMALLYPNLSAAVADIAPPSWRGSAIGTYRFWRDLGYGIGGLCLGLVSQLGGRLEAAFWFVALSMFPSGAILWRFGEESHPKFAAVPAAVR